MQEATYPVIVFEASAFGPDEVHQLGAKAGYVAVVRDGEHSRDHATMRNWADGTSTIYAHPDTPLDDIIDWVSVPVRL